MPRSRRRLPHALITSSPLFCCFLCISTLFWLKTFFLDDNFCSQVPLPWTISGIENISDKDSPATIIGSFHAMYHSKTQWTCWYTSSRFSKDTCSEITRKSSAQLGEKNGDDGISAQQLSWKVLTTRRRQHMQENSERRIRDLLRPWVIYRFIHPLGIRKIIFLYIVVVDGNLPKKMDTVTKGVYAPFEIRILVLIYVKHVVCSCITQWSVIR